MPTTDEIFAEFKEVIKRIDDYRLRNKLGNVVLDSVHKHRDNDLEIKQLKLNTKCSACGEKGHWQGDPECKKKSAAQITYEHEESHFGSPSNFTLAFDVSWEFHSNSDNSNHPTSCMTADDEYASNFTLVLEG